jgi:hypothetical protein
MDSEAAFLFRKQQCPGPPRNTPVRLVTFRSPKGVPGPYAGVMKTFVSKDALNRMALCVCLLSALPIVQGTETDHGRHDC